MATISRDEIVQRALDMFDKCGYIWGGYPGDEHHCYLGDDGNGVEGEPEEGEPLISTDCSGYVSWAWNLGYHANSSYWSEAGAFGGENYHKREAYTGIIEQDFPGIQPGDVLWKNGHVVIYIGDNTTLEASTQRWTNTETQTGMVKRTGSRGDMLGYCSYPDGTGTPEGENDPSKHKWEDDDGYYVTDLWLEERYTRRYELMRHWRNVK